MSDTGKKIAALFMVKCTAGGVEGVRPFGHDAVKSAGQDLGKQVKRAYNAGATPTEIREAIKEVRVKYEK